MKQSLEIKENESLALKEKFKIHNLINNHNAIFFNLKKHKFELKTKQKRKFFEEELISKVAKVEKKETEFSHKEVEVAKREHEN